MEANHVGRAVWRHKLLFLSVLVVAGVMTGVGLWFTPKTYEASAVVSAASAPSTASTSESLDSLRGSLAELANSEDVLRDVSAELSEPRSVSDLRQSISGTWVQGTILVRIDVTDDDPRMAAEIANAVATVLPRYDVSNGAFLFTTTDPARTPDTFASPDLLLGLGIGGALSVILAVCAALVRDRRTAGLGECIEIERFLGAPVLASLPRPKDSTNLPALYPGTAPADAFRQLRISLEAEASTQPVSLLVVADVDDEETSVWLGANIAISLATSGRRVLLVDGRVGDQGSALVAGPDTLGLYDVLTGADLDDALSPGPVDNLTVLPAGEWGGVTGERLLESGFASAMSEATGRHDVVVVLAPPLSAGPDARIMAAGASIVLSVPETGLTHHELGRHTSRLRNVGVRLLGVVLIGKRADRSPIAA